MVLAQALTATRRELKTKGYLNELKRGGRIPGVIYGQAVEPFTISLDSKESQRIFNHHGYRGLFSLQIEGETKPRMVLIRDIQRQPISQQVTHIDFLLVNMKETITSLVAVQILGEEEVTKRGGVVQTGAKEVEVSCLPANIPESFVCDISNLEVGDKLVVADLVVDPEVEILTDPETMLAAVLAPSRAAVEEETADGEGEEAATVEE
ncbi:MAG: 50S ribosomal protein L25 [Syntrophomonadaceae bacterium]|nr:50S ribosomal protein L25 [Syntrophomonadaceae bacterium]